ncbi:DUF2790 domain-containing protein [Pseudomonas hormoni]
MKTLKIAMFLALASVAAQAYSDETPTDAASQIPVESYSYGMKLDIQKIITVSDTGDECAPVPKQMTYEDSKGQRHILQYQVMGTGCSNG